MQPTPRLHRVHLQSDERHSSRDPRPPKVYPPPAYRGRPSQTPCPGVQYPYSWPQDRVSPPFRSEGVDLVGAQHACRAVFWRAAPGKHAWQNFAIFRTCGSPRPMWSAAARRRCLLSRLAGTCCNCVQRPALPQNPSSGFLPGSALSLCPDSHPSRLWSAPAAL
jgi:hypothetical protein